MHITIMGTGYVGLTTGVCLAHMGHQIVCLDIDETKIQKLQAGIIPIYEPGLADLLQENMGAGRITFSTDIAAGVRQAEVIFIAVGTPEDAFGQVNMTYINSATSSIGKYMPPGSHKVIVNKSTVPINTFSRVRELIQANLCPASTAFSVVSNPEFLREGSAVTDFLHPDRIIVGLEKDDEIAKAVMTRVYAPITTAHNCLVVTDIRSAELIKYACNAMLATRISFVNEIAALCEKTGADIKEVTYGMGLDSRIGPKFLSTGLGYGGSCFPKDIHALIGTMKVNNCSAGILTAVDAVNTRQKDLFIEKIRSALAGVSEGHREENLLEDKRIAVWGLAFKPHTNDIRDAPSRVVIRKLLEHGAHVVAYDPIVTSLPEVDADAGVDYASDMYTCLTDADCLLIVTEWDVFHHPDFPRMKQLMKTPVIIDGRNVYDPVEVKAQGFTYVGIGRGV